jgi:hypothetical protein
MLSSSVAELIDVVKRLEMAVDGDDIAAVVNGPARPPWRKRAVRPAAPARP